VPRDDKSCSSFVPGGYGEKNDALSAQLMIHEKKRGSCTNRSNGSENGRQQRLLRGRWR